MASPMLRFALCLAPILSLSPFGGLHAAPQALPYDCAMAAQAIGGPVDEMEPAPDQGWQLGPDEARLVCSWYTKPAAKAAGGQVLNREDYKDVGTLTAQLVIYGDPLRRADAEMMNAAHDLPPELDIAGAWLFSLKPLKMDGKLGIFPPEIMSDSLGVSVAYANSFATTTGTGSALTTGWSVATAARILTAATAAR